MKKASHAIWFALLAASASAALRTSQCTTRCDVVTGEGCGDFPAQCYGTGADAACETAWQTNELASGCIQGDPIAGVPPHSPWLCALAGQPSSSSPNALTSSGGDASATTATPDLLPPSTLRTSYRDGVPTPVVWSFCEHCALRASPGNGGTRRSLEVQLFDPDGSLTANRVPATPDFNGTRRTVLSQSNWAPFYYRKDAHTNPRSRIEGAFVPHAMDRNKCTRWVDEPTFVFHLLTWHVGHLLMDVIEPLHRTMVHEMGAVPEDALLVFDVAGADEKAVLHSALLGSVYRNDKPFQLLRTFTKRPIHTMSALAELPGVTCFRRLFLGLDASDTIMSEGALRRRHLPNNAEPPHDGGGATFWRDRLAVLDPAAKPEDLRVYEAYERFQSFVLPRLHRHLASAGRSSTAESAAAGGGSGTCSREARGWRCSNAAEPPQDSSSDVRSLSVTFVRRTSNRLVANYDSLVGVAAAALPESYVVRELTLEEMSFSEQVRVLQQTDVLVGQLGTGMHNVLFISKGSVAVLLVPPDWCAWSWMVADQAVAAGVHVLLECQEAKLPASARRWHRWRWCERCWREGPWYSRYRPFSVKEEAFRTLIDTAMEILRAGDAAAPKMQRLVLEERVDPVFSLEVPPNALPAARAHVGHVAFRWDESDGRAIVDIIPEVVANVDFEELGLEGSGNATVLALLGLPPNTDLQHQQQQQQRQQRGELQLRICVQMLVGEEMFEANCFRAADLNEQNTVNLRMGKELFDSPEGDSEVTLVVAMLWLQWGAGGFIVPDSETLYPIEVRRPNPKREVAAAVAMPLPPQPPPPLPQAFLWDEVRPTDKARVVLLVSQTLAADLDNGRPNDTTSNERVLSILLDSELRLQAEVLAFCRSFAPPFKPHQCGVVAMHANRQARAGGAAAAAGLPAVTVPPQPERPFVFLHLEKCGGTTVRDLIMSTAMFRNQHFFTPCYTEAGYDPTPAVCAQFNMQSLSEEKRAQLQVVAMHHERGWNAWKELPSVKSDDDFDCFVMLRRPIERVLAFYYERINVVAAGRFAPHTAVLMKDHWQAPEALATLMVHARGITLPGWLDPRNHSHQVYIDEGMSNAACKMLTGATLAGRRGPIGNVNDPGLLEPAHYDLETAKQRMGRCVVGLVEDWESTLRALRHWFPWLARDDPGITNRSWWNDWQPREKPEDLRQEVRDVIEEHNRCDLELYDVAVRQFEAQKRVIEIAEGKWP